MKIDEYLSINYDYFVCAWTGLTKKMTRIICEKQQNDQFDVDHQLRINDIFTHLKIAELHGNGVILIKAKNRFFSWISLEGRIKFIMLVTNILWYIARQICDCK